MEGPLVNIFAQIIKSLTNINITVPGKFSSLHNKKSIDVSVGPKSGPLFLLNQSLFFAQKPVIHIYFDNIFQINIHWLEDS